MNEAAALRVLLVEDSPLLCERISEVVAGIPGVELIASVGSEAAAVEVVRKGNVDVVILDLQLRNGTGFGVLRNLRSLERRPEVVVFTNFALATYRDNALALGARHFLDKARDYERLPSVLHEISAERH
jgi:two-component system OmpR family response regulator